MHSVRDRRLLFYRFMVDLCDLFTNILQAYSSGIGAVL